MRFIDKPLHAADDGCQSIKIHVVAGPDLSQIFCILCPHEKFLNSAEVGKSHLSRKCGGRNEIPFIFRREVDRTFSGMLPAVRLTASSLESDNLFGTRMLARFLFFSSRSVVC